MFDTVLSPEQLVQEYMILAIIPIVFAFGCLMVSLISIRKGKR